MKTCYRIINQLLLALPVILTGCNKAAALNRIPDTSREIIENVDQAQAALDNTTVMRETPSLGELSADDLYIPYDSAPPLNKVEINAYLWKQDIFEQQPLAGDWFIPYRQVYFANSVLSVLPHLSAKTTQENIDRLKGTALFIRAYAFFNLALEFASLYSTTTASDPGIPLRLTPDPEKPSVRATVKDTYEQILSDAKDALALLPREMDSKRKNRPAIPATFALLARICLSMADYASAKSYADSCLGIYPSIMDYNSLSPFNPFTADNPEVLYSSSLLSTTDLFYRENCCVDTTLYASYADQDLRKQLFFSTGSLGLPVPSFSYTGDQRRFSGLATDEVVLIRAECNARLGFKDEAVKDLTTLLTKRWKNGAYTAPSVNTADDVLELVLGERRKELVFRGTRWTDIRRLNKINPAITLRRLLNDNKYVLPPGDARYVLPIPPDVINFNTGMPQNHR